MFNMSNMSAASSIRSNSRRWPRGSLLALLIQRRENQRVLTDDCRELDGAVIEAKGHYEEEARKDDFISARIDQQWVRQATR